MWRPVAAMEALGSLLDIDMAEDRGPWFLDTCAMNASTRRD
jgi:hypothetical protein